MAVPILHFLLCWTLLVRLLINGSSKAVTVCYSCSLHKSPELLLIERQLPNLTVLALQMLHGGLNFLSAHFEWIFWRLSDISSQGGCSEAGQQQFGSVVQMAVFRPSSCPTCSTLQAARRQKFVCRQSHGIRSPICPALWLVL